MRAATLGSYSGSPARLKADIRMEIERVRAHQEADSVILARGWIPDICSGARWPMGRG